MALTMLPFETPEEHIRNALAIMEASRGNMPLNRGGAVLHADEWLAIKARLDKAVRQLEEERVRQAIRELEAERVRHRLPYG